MGTCLCVSAFVCVCVRSGDKESDQNRPLNFAESLLSLVFKSCSILKCVCQVTDCVCIMYGCLPAYILVGLHSWSTEMFFVENSLFLPSYHCFLESMHDSIPMYCEKRTVAAFAVSEYLTSDIQPLPHASGWFKL